MLIRDSVAAFERTFLGRVRAYYVEGSWADGTMLETSDVDLVVVFKGDSSEIERQQAAVVRATCQEMSPLELDIGIVDEAALVTGASPQLMLGARLVYGEDIRSRLVVMPTAAWTRDRMHTSYWRTIKLFQRPVPVCLPVEYPDPTDEFYGYLRRPTRLPNGSTATGTRDLVRSVGWIATALVAWRAARYVVSKQDCHRAYRAYIGDQWSALVEDIYTLCRGSWRYQIPSAEGDRTRLRAVCEQTLAFENAFLSTYRAFLLDELQDGSQADRTHAHWVLEQLPWKDAAVEVALQQSASLERRPGPREEGWL